MIPSGLVVIMIIVVRVIIRVLLIFLVLFLLLLEAAKALGIVNNLDQIMLSVKITPILSLYIVFLGEFSILGRNIHPLGYLTSPASALSSTYTRLLSFSDCSLEILYSRLQYKN